jgi:uncharacterized membrane protein YkvA (DUF1232 family)
MIDLADDPCDAHLFARQGRRENDVKTSDAEGQASRVGEGFWRTVRRASQQIPFMQEVVAAYYCAMDRRTPLRVKGVIFAALGYFILPADTIPDMIFGLGFTDDIAVLTAAISTISAHIKPSHRAAAKAMLSNKG